MDMQKIMVKSGLLLLALVGSNSLFAGTPPPPPPPPAGASIDAGAIILLVIGVALAINKMYQQKKKAVLKPAVALANK